MCIFRDPCLSDCTLTIVQMDNKAVPLDQVSGLQVAVLWSEVQPAESRSEFPKKVGDYQVLYKPTDGRPGGFQKGDGLG